jgi:hypothetical protein
MLRRIKHNIADSNVQVKLREGSLRHHCIHRISGPAIRSASEVHRGRADSERKEVIQVTLSSLLEEIEHLLPRGRRRCAHGEVEILCGARNPETKFHPRSRLLAPTAYPRYRTDAQEGGQRQPDVATFAAPYPLLWQFASVALRVPHAGRIQSGICLQPR